MTEGVLDLKAGDDLLSHGKRHTTISAKRFHFWVREGIRWFTLAIVASKLLWCFGVLLIMLCFHFMSALLTNQRVINGLDIESNFVFSILTSFHTKSSYVLNLSWIQQLFGCCIVKPHEQLVLVSFTRHRASTPNLSTSWSRTAL